MPVPILAMAHSLSAVRVRPVRSGLGQWLLGKGTESGEIRTLPLGSMFANLADKLRDSRPVARASGGVELLDVVGGLGLGVGRRTHVSDGLRLSRGAFQWQEAMGNEPGHQRTVILAGGSTQEAEG